MDPKVQQRWETISNVLKQTCFFTGLALIAYVATAVSGFVSSSARHYTLFTLAVMFMSGLTAMRNVIEHHMGRVVTEEGMIEEGEPQDPVRGNPSDQHPWWFGTKLFLVTLCTVLVTVSAAYIYLNADRLEQSAPLFTDTDMMMGYIFTATVLILTFLHWGVILTTIIALSIAYFFFGHHFHHFLLHHPHYEPAFVMNYIGLGVTQGFYWFAQTAVDDIFFLVIYAATLFGLGMLVMILEVGKIMGSKIQGGAAGPAIFGSAVVAAVMGTAVSNVMLCGRFTIPMMKKYGYSPGMAGAIEATASTAGQIMPPVLGLAAFLIAGMLGIAYVEVVKAAVVPGLLYITGVIIGVAVYAKKHKLPKLKEMVNYGIIWRLLPTFVISFITVIVMLLHFYSPSVAGLTGTIVAIVLAYTLQGPYRPKWKELREAVCEGLMLMALLALLLIAIGPLGQAFQTTSLSGKLGVWLITVLPDNSLLLLLGAAVLSIVLGMGLPTPVAYLVVALAMVPFMQQLGVPALQAHYFVFYFAVYSALSPPVAVAALAGAKLAGSSFWECGLHSMKIAATTFIIPFAFVYRTDLMSFPNLGPDFWPALFDVLMVQLVTSIALYGYFRRNLATWERWAFGALTFIGYWSIISKPVYTTVIFYLLSAVMLGYLWLTARLAAPADAGRTGEAVRDT